MGQRQGLIHRLSEHPAELAEKQSSQGLCRGAKANGQAWVARFWDHMRRRRQSGLRSFSRGKPGRNTWSNQPPRSQQQMSPPAWPNISRFGDYGVLTAAGWVSRQIIASRDPGKLRALRACKHAAARHANQGRDIQGLCLCWRYSSSSSSAGLCPLKSFSAAHRTAGQFARAVSHHHVQSWPLSGRRSGLSPAYLLTNCRLSVAPLAFRSHDTTLGNS